MTDGHAVTGRTRVVSVWGHPVSHSRSPVMHNVALAALGLDWVYVPFDVDPTYVGEAVRAVRAIGLVGVNVTVPLKEAILPYLDEVSADARAVGSVNTIHNREGHLYGTSTDGAGLLNALRTLGQEVSRRRVYMLGAGGSARAVAFALAGLGSRVQIANRTVERAVALADIVNGHYPGSATVAAWGGEAEPFDLLVNTTSLGMSPREDELPALPPDAFRGRPFVYDLIYAPPETRLLRAARQAGCGTANGVGMLVQQGALSLSLWTGRPLEQLPIGLMAEAVEAALAGRR